MKKKTRRIVFYSLAVLFFLAAPLLLGYAVGYRFDFSRGVLERTGGIFVKSKNSRVTLFLNGTFLKETSFFSNGALLPEIPPGTHLLRIEKMGFHPWSKTVTVRPTIVTELRNVVLVANPVTPATSTAREVARLVPPPLSATSSLSINKQSNLVLRMATTTVVLAGDVAAFWERENSVLFVNKNGFLAELDLSSRAVATLGRPGFYLDGKPLRFVASPRGHVAIIDFSGGLFMLSPEKALSPITGGVKDVAFDEEGKKALVRKEQELEIIWLGANEYQPFQKPGTRETLFSITTPITDAAWFFDDNAHIFLYTADGLFFTEIDGRGGRNTIELIPGKIDEIATTPETPDTIFYRKGKVWFKIKI